MTTVAWTTGAANTTFNFNGGTLRAGTSSTAFLGTGTNAVNLYESGGTLDANNNAITITQPFQNASYSGILLVAVTADSTIFASPPTVAFTGGTGSGGAAYATLNSTGQVTGIVVTNAGSYSVAPTLTINGTTDALAPTLAANNAGGLTIISSTPGSGALVTLTGSNSYTGNTTISAGTLAIGGAGFLGGGNYAGTIANSGLLAFASSSNQVFGGAITGSGGLTQSGPGLLTLSNAGNTYSGGHECFRRHAYLSGARRCPTAR